MMIQLGDKIQRRIPLWTPEHPKGSPEKVTVTATVVYIHPQRRYFVLEYETAAGRYRECELCD